MTLVDREIKEQHDDLILQGYDEKNVNPTSYDLTIGSILSGHGESDVFTLLPNATVFAKTKEEIHIPDNLCGHIGEKNSRMREGLWVSGPTYFPGHTTFVFLRVRNVSQNEITIKAGDKIAQISFEKLGTTPDHPYNTISSASFNEEDAYRGMGKYTSEYEKRIRPVSDKRDKLATFALIGLLASIFLLGMVNFVSFPSKVIVFTINLSLGIIIGLFAGLLKLALLRNPKGR